jgi:hypothetical protein
MSQEAAGSGAELLSTTEWRALKNICRTRPATADASPATDKIVTGKEGK